MHGDPRGSGKWLQVTATSALDAEGVHESCSDGLSRLVTRMQDAQDNYLLLVLRGFDVEDDEYARIVFEDGTRQGERQLTASRPFSVGMEGSGQV